MSGPRDVFILYQRDDESGTKYKIQRTLAEGARDIQWYTPEQMEQGVLNLLLPPWPSTGSSDHACMMVAVRVADSGLCSTLPKAKPLLARRRRRKF